jgi:hypothetical protein
MPALETVIFNGVKYRRYAKSPYFIPGVADTRNGAQALHRDIWRAANSEIPAGHDIHHRDGNPLNNDLANLQLMTVADHQALHTAERHASGFYRTPERLARLDSIRPLSKPWHSSEAGRELHARNGKKVIEALATREATCARCGKLFQFKSMQIPSYCSGACKAAQRRASGIDDENRQCGNCGATFRINRYSKSKACGKVCGQRLRRAQEVL